MPAAKEDNDYICFTHKALPSDASKRNYSFCFDKTVNCSQWVAYPLHACYFVDSGVRTDNFGYDKEFESAWESYAGQYQANIGTGAYYSAAGVQTHSRGHQLPSADRNRNTADNNTTFYATNMTPQLQTLNGGMWQQLEGKVRQWASSDTLYVVTGAYFANKNNLVYDNKGNGKACPVPTSYYKVVLKSRVSGKWVVDCAASELQCIGFWVDHAAGSWSITGSVRSVEEIENLTGFSFFANVPYAPKSSYTLSDWNL